MAGTAAELAGLIRLYRWEVDERRRALGALISREHDLVLFGQQLDLQLQRESAIFAQDPTIGGRLFGAFLQDHKLRREKLAQTLADLRDQIERARDELQDAYRLRRTTEEVQERRTQREEIEANRREQAVLDEIAQTQHRLKGG